MPCMACKTAEGPFTRRERLGPLCRPSLPSERIEDWYPAKADPRIVACNRRRQAIDNAREEIPARG